jgi:hypothetical protein
VMVPKLAKQTLRFKWALEEPSFKMFGRLRSLT